MKYLLLSIALIVFAFSLFGQNYSEELKIIDKYIDKSYKDWEIPGIAIAIVKDDSVIFAKGYGVRDLEEGGKVDENTMFGIASNTKAFTSAALAILVDQKKISWDDRVIDHLPYFELYDPYVTNEMRIRDLLCHRSGLKTFSGDLLWHSTNYSREDIIRRIKFLEPTYGFRSHYGYSNLMFLTAGEIIPEVTGISYDEFLREKFFVPLGMNNTNTTINSFEKVKNLAQPHDKYNGKMIKVKYINWDNIAPAGAINSTVMDMSKWIKLQLNHGKYKSKTYFSKQVQKELWTPYTCESLGQTDEFLFPSKHFDLYGLGWDLFDYHGRKVINHSGGLDGMISQLALVPEDDLGFVILTNSMNYLPYALMYKIMDVFFEKEGKDYSSIFKSFLDQRDEYMDLLYVEEEKARDKNSKPSLSLEKYTGTYSGNLYGDATVKLEGGELVLQFVPAPEFISELNHWQYDTFEIEFKAFPSLPKGKVNFTVDQNGVVEEMRIDVPNPDFDFKELKFFKIK